MQVKSRSETECNRPLGCHSVTVAGPPRTDSWVRKHFVTPVFAHRYVCAYAFVVRSGKSAYIQSIGEAGPQGAELQDRQPGAAGMPAKAWCLHPRLYPDA